MTPNEQKNLGVNLPKRRRIDWSKAKYGNCACGQWAAIAEGQCPDCHDADYQSDREGAYINRIRELMEENSKLNAQVALQSCIIYLDVELR